MYNSSLEYHLNVKREEEQAKINANKKKRPQPAPAPVVDEPSSKAPTAEPESPRKAKEEPGTPAPLSKRASMGDDVDRAVSPASTASSGSEPPLAQRLKANGVGNHSAKSAPPSAATAPQDTSETPTPPAAQPPPLSAGNRPVASSAPPASRPSAKPPQWLSDATAEMQAKYPEDRFEVMLRRVATSSSPEWRIRCTDCPGKLYTPGPGETLTNYEVHLKNRQHRQKVNIRLGNAPNTPM